jgi:hypothetical protein
VSIVTTRMSLRMVARDVSSKLSGWRPALPRASLMPCKGERRDAWLLRQPSGGIVNDVQSVFSLTKGPQDFTGAMRGDVGRPAPINFRRDLVDHEIQILSIE